MEQNELDINAEPEVSKGSGALVFLMYGNPADPTCVLQIRDLIQPDGRNTIGPYGGLRRNGETIEEGAAREVREELITDTGEPVLPSITAERLSTCDKRYREVHSSQPAKAGKPPRVNDNTFLILWLTNEEVAKISEYKERLKEDSSGEEKSYSDKVYEASDEEVRGIFIATYSELMDPNFRREHNVSLYVPRAFYGEFGKAFEASAIQQQGKSEGDISVPEVRSPQFPLADTRTDLEKRKESVDRGHSPDAKRKKGQGTGRNST